MTRKSQGARVSSVVLVLVGCMTAPLLSQQTETTQPQHLDRLALLGEVNSPPLPMSNKGNEPVPFTMSTMAGDLVPPFVNHPELEPVKTSKEKPTVSFDENMPVKQEKVESIDDCCRELSEMIAGNLESEISLDAKKRMIETALKMVARNVALKAEAKITKLKADHALEMARVQGQMGQMRSMGTAADQINRVAGPLSQILQRNYQQAAAMSLANQHLSQSLAQLGFNQIEEESRMAQANRERIQLATPSPTVDQQRRVAELTEQVSRLQQQLNSQQPQKQYVPSAKYIQRAGYNQPLQPRRQPLAPMSQEQSSPRYQGYPYQAPDQWQSRN